MRVGVVGPVAPDYFAENVGDALARTGMSSPSWVGQRSPSRSDELPRGDAGEAGCSSYRRAGPSPDRSCCLAARCEVIINLDAHLITRTR